MRRMRFLAAPVTCLRQVLALVWCAKADAFLQTRQVEAESKGVVQGETRQRSINSSSINFGTIHELVASSAPNQPRHDAAQKPSPVACHVSQQVASSIPQRPAAPGAAVDWGQHGRGERAGEVWRGAGRAAPLLTPRSAGYVSFHSESFSGLSSPTSLPHYLTTILPLSPSLVLACPPVRMWQEGEELVVIPLELVAVHSWCVHTCTRVYHAESASKAARCWDTSCDWRPAVLAGVCMCASVCMCGEAREANGHANLKGTGADDTYLKDTGADDTYLKDTGVNPPCRLAFRPVPIEAPKEEEEAAWKEEEEEEDEDEDEDEEEEMWEEGPALSARSLGCEDGGVHLSMFADLVLQVCPHPAQAGTDIDASLPTRSP
eukprot:Tamp_18901.p1 GENE.Tamp_18901~~Tamp_18901.p1  ORF type:complete len:376 (-),score=62.43 Tamp_18901:107-1234(-)